MVQKREKLFRDPASEFRDPKHLLERNDISLDDKRLLLESWHADLVQQERADEENMSAANEAAGDTAAMLSKVREAIALVRERQQLDGSEEEIDQ